jgi:hypothetical protein
MEAGMQMNYGRAVRELIDSGAVRDRSFDQDLDLEGVRSLGAARDNVGFVFGRGRGKRRLLGSLLGSAAARDRSPPGQQPPS